LWKSVILTNPRTGYENGRSLSRPQHSFIRPTRLLCARLSLISWY